MPVDNILFASEMVGAVKGNDPKTGFGFDDTKRYVEGTSLSAADKAKVFEGNARKVYPRINKISVLIDRRAREGETRWHPRTITLQRSSAGLEQTTRI